MAVTGVYAPIPTPFDEQDRLDTVRLKSALQRWVTGPLDGFVVLGSNGEAALMDDEECDRAIAVAREEVASGKTLIAGTGRESTVATVRATRRAASLGADAVLVRTPGFFKSQMTADVFVRHYTTVAEASPVPVLLYNFTAVTGVDLPPAAVARLASHPNIAGMKESGGDVSRIAELVALPPQDSERFSVIAGSATSFYASLCVGASAGILALANVLPEPCVRLYNLVHAGRHEEARALQAQIAPLSRLLGNAYGVPGLKAALKLQGVDVGVPRLPLTPLPDAGIAALRDALARFQEVTA